tara:strand:- start:2262 stop:3842 length:1581 start_codon:yes stop_codon:yes gene_type:complete
MSKHPRTELQCLDDAEWLLKRPDTMIGSLEPEAINTFKVEGKGKDLRVLPTTVTTSPALLVLARELTSNASDNYSRATETPQTFVRIKVDPENGAFEVSNDGATLPVEPFEGGDTWSPTIAFSSFRSSSNYDDTQERQGVGRNGVGSKGVNVFSERFEVTINDPLNKKKFQQQWSKNMGQCSAPKVTKATSIKPVTTVRWTPAFDRLKLGPREEGPRFTPEECIAFEELAVSMAICSPSNVKVFFNDQQVALRSTEMLVKGLIGGVGVVANDQVIDARGVTRLSVSVAAKPPGQEPRAFFYVNGAACHEGTHAVYLMKKITDLVVAKMKKSKKEADMTVKPAALRSEMVIAASLVVNQPSYTSQQKSSLASKASDFGFQWMPDERFADKLVKTDLPTRALELGRATAELKLEKSSKVPRRVNVPKYQPAEKLRSGNASLIVCEGAPLAAPFRTLALSSLSPCSPLALPSLVPLALLTPPPLLSRRLGPQLRHGRVEHTGAQELWGIPRARQAAQRSRRQRVPDLEQ